MFGIITDVMVTAFHFVTLNGYGSLLVSQWQENKNQKTQSSVLTHEFEFFLPTIRPTIRARFHFFFSLRVRREEEVETRRHLSPTLHPNVYQCVHILNKLVCRENRI